VVGERRFEGDEGEKVKEEPVQEASADDPWAAYMKPQVAYSEFRKTGVMPKDGLKVQEEEKSATKEEFEQSLQPYKP
jgi:hypothetical protein